MSVFVLLIPDFSLIVLGCLLMRRDYFDTAFWLGLERLIYYLLFPALLFYSTATTRFNFAEVSKLLTIVMCASFLAMLLASQCQRFFPASGNTFASGVQTAFRFNSYLALALAQRLTGEAGSVLMAILIGFMVPLCNLAAIFALARDSKRWWLEILKNPLVLATTSGLLFSLLQLPLATPLIVCLERLGKASLALGLLSVGAGLRWSALAEARALAGAFIAIKLLLLPALAVCLTHFIPLSPVHQQIAILFCALPTASSAYVLTARMGGNASYVAFLISASTLLSAFSLPFWLNL